MIITPGDTNDLQNGTITNFVAKDVSLTNRQLQIPGDAAVTIASGLIFLSKGSAAAITVAAPTAAQNGTEITFISLSAFAHVITIASGVWDGTATVNTTLTFAALAGAACTIVSNGVLWYTKSLNAVVPAP